MLDRLKLLLCVIAFLFLAACGGSKGSDAHIDSGGAAGKGGPTEPPAPKADEVKKASDEANALTEENHRLAREIFDLKNKLGEE